MDATWIAASSLWLVLDREAAAPRSLLDVAAQALAGGVDVVMCRVKDATSAELRQLALPLRELCRERQAPFVISHDAVVAQDLAADALHLGAGDAPVREVRQSLRAGIAIGYSAHSVQESAEAMAAGADYAFLGPIFPTPAKLRYGPPLGLGVVRPALALPKPSVFIGGISPETLPALVRLGARRIAAIGALQAVPDVQTAACAMRRLLAPR